MSCVKTILSISIEAGCDETTRGVLLRVSSRTVLSDGPQPVLPLKGSSVVGNQHKIKMSPLKLSPSPFLLKKAYRKIQPASLKTVILESLFLKCYLKIHQ